VGHNPVVARARVGMQEAPFSSLAREMGNAGRSRVCIPNKNKRTEWPATQTSQVVGAVQSALGVSWRGREIFVLDTFPLQLAKAGSAATLPP